MDHVHIPAAVTAATAAHISAIACRPVLRMLCSAMQSCGTQEGRQVCRAGAVYNYKPRAKHRGLHHLRLCPLHQRSEMIAPMHDQTDNSLQVCLWHQILREQFLDWMKQKGEQQSTEGKHLPWLHCIAIG